MPFQRLLIANRGEISVRIAGAAAELNIPTVTVYAQDDSKSLHVRKADASVALNRSGPAAYLDGEELIRIARDCGCDAIHPGYGFLSENPGFARQCEAAGVFFIGPSPAVLDVFGDKASARQLARKHGVPLIHGTNEPTSLESARSFMKSLGEPGTVMLKAIAGGGGRGMRPVHSLAELESAFYRCQSEATAAFGNGDLYIEQLIPDARHIEVQIIGDGTAVTHLWERDCTLQRRNQKVMEIAPAPGLSAELRDQLLADAEMLSRAVGYRGLCTIEFLVDMESGHYVFLEANPRVQVEHTITEAITGLDLVQLQILVAAGMTLAELGLDCAPEPRGRAVQLRINLETMAQDGSARPAGGTIEAYEPPTGPGVRVDGYGYAGYTTSPAYDSLLAKLIVHSEGDYSALLRRAYRALCEFRLEGVPSNIGLLQNILQHNRVQSNELSTRFIDTHAAELIPNEAKPHPGLYFEETGQTLSADNVIAVGPEGSDPITAPAQGVVVSIDAAPGQAVVEGQQVAVLEAMKMEFVIRAGQSGHVVALAAGAGEAVYEDQPLMFIEPGEMAAIDVSTEESMNLDHIRADLQKVLSLHDQLTDDKRPGAVAKRRKTGQRTARENLADLLDDGSFMEYGALALAAQRTRRSAKELQALSPADGLIAGIGTVNGELFAPQTARCMAMSYDYTVFAGTQGVMNHKKTDRMLELAEKQRLPLVFFTEGGGGRPGDVDWIGVAGLDCTTFMRMARLSGTVPLIGIASGRCFAGNAALLGCCDVIIATENATIGMAGPAMIEGGGLGRFMPEEVGPVSTQSRNGVVDIIASDEEEATRMARQYLAFFQGDVPAGEAVDQRELRHLIPENRLRVYDIRRVINALADQDSVIELRPHFAPGMITALVRIQGKAFGLIANNPMHLGGAIDAVAADKATRFMQLCDAHGLPLLSLCDTPGFMVGPEAEKQATVRHVSRMFVTAASMVVPFFTVVLRKGYGLGAQAMAAGSFHAPMFTIGWPSSEFGAMGLEGAVRLGFARELAAIEDQDERNALFDKLVGQLYERGKGVSMASFLEIDAVIDPAETRDWLIRGLNSVDPESLRGGHRPVVDTW
ncbi:carboxyl transferase domain-containing protein [Marinobacter orientalis]|uniref:acetyl-CoA carboxylase n=1 Tax=Marinobacter orientalis TaxID=1928859 RepID=A0A7Y0REM0_9GAMM|nr:carboxyl transferase domain-containing protein [Marinobacter orientalis]NMT64817.1 ATP-grasp domain-containing protein [Marinobacter orientalis]TGX48808.1 ATP-grasp domain-containing protein [Marinobacter orientalis]